MIKEILYMIYDKMDMGHGTWDKRFDI